MANPRHIVALDAREKPYPAMCGEAIPLDAAYYIMVEAAMDRKVGEVVCRKCQAAVASNLKRSNSKQ